MSVTGSGTTINFIWNRFAANKNIKEFQEGMNEILYKLRFKRSTYRWYKGADEYQYFDMNSKKDSEL
jgi:hypothetical protein